MFLAFQYPTEIPGVNTNNFLRTSLNSIRKAKGQKDLDAINFLKIVKEKAKEVEVEEKDSDLLEASKTEDQQLQEFKADATGGEGALASVVKGAEVPEPASTGSASRGADKSQGDSTPPADAQKASVSKAALISQVMGKMNNMSKETLMKLSGEVDTYGKNNYQQVSLNQQVKIQCQS